MEPRPRAEVGPDRLRRLNSPDGVEVRLREGMPMAVRFRKRWRTVSRVEQAWRIEEGWWREQPVRRTYFRVALDDGALVLTLFEEAGDWWLQKY